MLTHPVRSPDDLVPHIRYDPMKITEDEMFAIWSISIRPEFRAGGKRKQYEYVLTDEQREKQIQNRQDYRRRVQVAHAEACVPEREEDEDIIRLYREGKKVQEIADMLGNPFSFTVVRNRLVACHPTAETLK